MRKRIFFKSFLGIERRSFSKLVNDAISESLAEDAEDIAAI